MDKVNAIFQATVRLPGSDFRLSGRFGASMGYVYHPF